MQQDFIERLEAFLRDEGFANLSTQRASHDVTLTAANGKTRLVAHLSDRVSVPSRAQPADEVPAPAVIAIRPQVPGIPAGLAAGGPGWSSGSGATGGS